MNSYRPNLNRTFICRQQGGSLLELMIGMLVGMILITGSLTLFSNTAKNLRAQEAMARLMDSGRFAMEILARNLRLAGYWGCSGWEVANLSNHLGSNQRGIYGTNDDGANGSDTIRSTHAADQTHSDNPGIVFDDGDGVVTLPEPITIGKDHGIQGTDLLLINDCDTGDVFNLKSVQDTTVTPCCTQTHGDTACGSSSCLQAYRTNASVYKVRDRIYYIGTGVNGNPALFQCDAKVNLDECAGSREELIEGVENLQVSFGEDTNGDGVANRYVSAAVIDAPCNVNQDCWARVVSLRISLLMRTLEGNIASKPQTYMFDGNLVTATDKHLRHEYSATIWLRNHRS